MATKILRLPTVKARTGLSRQESVRLMGIVARK
uniref:Uncharacterized protein n=1 Tax=Candidatus Kentrum sp. FM TaxID=2126340 RepID=A0A450S8B3_9GAMM|nr:MAG: hypothetical protein BECKFM1743A_GA0114220_1005513 [Candidatus Kentron sp. FM]VFJ48783.1 MAG: hypothetical protein BECKFM1743C_GA0114222_1006313 [Candidatus Kentron sp. FM]